MKAFRIPWIGLVLLGLVLAARGESPFGAQDFHPSGSRPVGWRGDGSGRFPGAHPLGAWDGVSGSNILWRVPLSGRGNGSPIVVGSRVFVCVNPATLVCLDAENGAIRWSRTHPHARTRFDEGGAYWDRLEEWVGYATPTPVSDGTYVYAVFAGGAVAAYDVDGNLRWQTTVDWPERVRQGPPTSTRDLRKRHESSHPVSRGRERWFEWGLIASPVLSGDRLVIQKGDLLALDVRTGRERWRTEVDESFGNTPLVLKLLGTEVIINHMGNILRSSDGRLLLSQQAFGWGQTRTPDGGGRNAGRVNRTAVPVVDGNRLYFLDLQPTGAQVEQSGPENLAVTLLYQEPSKVLDDDVVHYSSPVLQEGYAYTVTGRGTYQVMEMSTGRITAQKKLRSPTGSSSAFWYANICLVGENLVVMDEFGATHILRPGVAMEETAYCPMQRPVDPTSSEVERFTSNAFYVGARIYLRSWHALYCIGGQP